MFDHPVYFILPLFIQLIQEYIGLAWSLMVVWFPATPAHEDKKCYVTASGYPTKKPECPACQRDSAAMPTPEMPPVIENHYGRPKHVDTSNHYCPETDCSYYGWLGLNNIVSNGHPNGGIWRQLQCVVCEKYFMETTGTIFYGLIPNLFRSQSAFGRISTAKPQNTGPGSVITRSREWI